MSKLAVTVGGHTYQIEFTFVEGAEEIIMQVDGAPVTVTRPDAHVPFESCSWLIIDGRPLEIEFDRDLHWIRSKDKVEALDIVDCEANVTRPRSGDGRIKAPIPGLITHVLVNVGDQVSVGQPLLYLEAMKMQNEIRAPFNGVVKVVHISGKVSVLRDQVLAEIE